MGYFTLGPDYLLSAGSFLIEDTTPNNKFELPMTILISIIIGSIRGYYSGGVSNNNYEI
jgi:hypothetical protein